MKMISSDLNAVKYQMDVSSNGKFERELQNEMIKTFHPSAYKHTVTKNFVINLKIISTVSVQPTIIQRILM
jgi:hypothetical protein